MQYNFVTKKNYTITIDKLYDEDVYATISSSSDELMWLVGEEDDVGRYFNWSNFRLINDILEPQNASGVITLITSTQYNTMSDDEITNNVKVFLSSLEGRRITVSVSYSYIQSVDDEVFVSNSEEDTKVVYVGYIVESPEDISVSGGAIFAIKCLPLIAQLDEVSPNVAWKDTTETYGGPAVSTIKNAWSKDALEMLIFDGTLFDRSKDELVYEYSPDYPQLPESDIWAFIIPETKRLEIFHEILSVYSLILYQRANGSLAITPLFYDDKTSECFNIDVTKNNLVSNYINFGAINRSIKSPNRVDATLVDLPGSPFGIDSNNSYNAVIASAPYVQQDDTYGEIVDLPNQKLKYTEIYSTKTRLYNSGKFVQPEKRSISLDNMLTEANNPMANIIMQRAKLDASSVNSSTETTLNSFAQLYAQMYLAEINVNAYSATVTYDYDQVILGNDPLGKIINVTGSNKLDYPDNLVTNTTLSVSSDTGSIFTIKTAPLLSVTACWYAKGENNV